MYMCIYIYIYIYIYNKWGMLNVTMTIFMFAPCINSIKNTIYYINCCIQL